MKLVASRRPRSTLAVIALSLATLGACAAVYRDSHSPSSSAASPATSDEKPVKHDEVPQKLGRAAHPGLRHEYAVKLDQDLRLATTAAGAAAKTNTKSGNDAIHLKLKGNLALAFVAHVNGAHRVFAEMTDVSLDAGESSSSPHKAMTATIQAELAKPFYVMMDPDGRVRGYEFARDLTGAAMNILRSVISSAQVAFEFDSNKTEWTAAEDDVQGSYTATYSRSISSGGEQQEIRKTKGHYDRVATMSSVIPATKSGTVVDTKMNSAAHVSTDGWVIDLKLDEHRVATMSAEQDAKRRGDVPVATTDLHLELTSLTTAAAPPRTDLSLLGRFEREQSTLVEVGPFGTGDEDAAQRSSDERLAGTTSMDEMLASSRGVTEDRARIQIGSRLTARMRLTSGDCDRAASVVKTKGTSPKDAEILVSALGAANTKESTAALGSIVTSGDASTEARSQAATTLAFARGDRALDAREPLFRAMSDSSSPSDVQQSATLALGNVARELGDSDGESVSELVHRFETAKDDDERNLYLRALGNTGSLEVLPVAKTALQSENAALRVTAAQALRFLPVGEADALLDRVMLSDAADGVRISAVQAIGYRLVEMHAASLERAVLALTPADQNMRAAIVEIVQRALAKRGQTLTSENRNRLSALSALALKGS